MGIGLGVAGIVYGFVSGRVGTACQPSYLSGRGATASRPFAALRRSPRRPAIDERHPRSVRSPDPTLDSARDVIHHQDLIEDAAEEGDEFLVGWFVEVLLFEDFLRCERHREDVGEALVEAFRAHVGPAFKRLDRRQLTRQRLERIDDPLHLRGRSVVLELEHHDVAVGTHPPSEAQTRVAVKRGPMTPTGIGMFRGR